MSTLEKLSPELYIIFVCNVLIADSLEQSAVVASANAYTYIHITRIEIGIINLNIIIIITAKLTTVPGTATETTTASGLKLGA